MTTEISEINDDLIRISYDDDDEDQNDEVNQETIDKYKTILKSLVSAGSIKEYTNKALTHDKIDKLPNNEIEKLYSKYEMINGQKMSASIKKTLVQIYSHTINHILPIDDVSALESDILNDPVIATTLDRYAPFINNTIGSFLAPINLASLTFNHMEAIKFRKNILPNNIDDDRNRDSVEQPTGIPTSSTTGTTSGTSTGDSS